MSLIVGLIVIFYGIVHQADLDLEEKILRHFDLSSQYGVCKMKLYVETCFVPALRDEKHCSHPFLAVHWYRSSQALATGEHVEVEPADRGSGGSPARRECERAGAYGRTALVGVSRKAIKMR